MGRKSTEKQRKPKTAKTKQWMIDLLPKLQTIPLDSLTMDELASLIPKSKSTLYEYFQTKEELLEYAVVVKLEDLKDYHQFLAQDQDAAVDQFFDLITYLCKGIEGIRSHFLNQLQQHYPSIWNLIRFFLDQLVQDIKRTYLIGMRQGVLTPINVDLIVALDEHFVTQIITSPHFFETAKLTLDQVVRDYLTLRFEGLRVRG